MPDPPPPDVGLLTRWVLENPWPLGVLLVGLAVVVAWRAQPGESRRRHLLISGALAAAGAALVITGRLVVTSGERAREVTRSLLEAVVAGDADAASAHFSADATLSFGSPTNPGLPRGALEDRIRLIEDRHRIRSNRVTELSAYTESSQRATVHLGCSTTTEGFDFGPVATQWVLVVERRPDGSWQITRVTWMTLAGQRVNPGTGM